MLVGSMYLKSPNLGLKVLPIPVYSVYAFFPPTSKVMEIPSYFWYSRLDHIEFAHISALQTQFAQSE